MTNQAYNYQRKNRRKVIWTIIQICILFVLSWWLIKAIFYLNQYEDREQPAVTNRFIALSYYGVGLTSEAPIIAKKQLEEHLTLLKEQGFETVSQQQLIDFYDGKSLLPAKALFLSFEDGRTDSSVHAQSILERLNYKATIFTYAEKLSSKDTKFLNPKVLQTMEKSGYWEIATNGYRLSYINAIDDEQNYYGDIDDINAYKNLRYYNHYLMDYRRDHLLLPIETEKQMRQRLIADYDAIDKTYMKQLGKTPTVYAIMHGNALFNQMPEAVEAVNSDEIMKRFQLHFNHGDAAGNDDTTNRYDLNRLQVSATWPINHLLMRIQETTTIPMRFEVGDEELATSWQVQAGVAYFAPDRITLTTDAAGASSIRYAQSIPLESQVSFVLNGAVVGEQRIELGKSLHISFLENRLEVKTPEKTLLVKELAPLEWEASDYRQTKATYYTLNDVLLQPKKETLPHQLLNERAVSFYFDEETLYITVDKTLYKIPYKIGQARYDLYLAGYVIESEQHNYQYSDTIYDAVYEDVKIQLQDEVLFTTEPSRWVKIKTKIASIVQHILRFFIETF